MLSRLAPFGCKVPENEINWEEAFSGNLFMKLTHLTAGVLFATTISSASQADILSDCSQEKDLVLSIEACTDVIQSNLLPGKSAMTYYFRGNAHRRVGNIRRAISDLKRSIEIDPGYQHPYIDLGLISKSRKKYAEAIDYYNEAIAIDPRFAKAYYNRGNVYWHKKQYEQAIKDYDKATTLEPKYVFPFIGRAYAEYELGNYEAALENADTALKLAPGNGSVEDIRTQILSKLTKG